MRTVEVTVVVVSSADDTTDDNNSGQLLTMPSVSLMHDYLSLSSNHYMSPSISPPTNPTYNHPFFAHEKIVAAV